jgi:hypothetical protein
MSCRSACELRGSRAWLVAIAGAALLAACTESPVATQSYSYREDVPGLEQHAASLGPTTVAIYNSPYPNDDVIAAMQGRTPGPQMTFTAKPDASATYRVVMVFGESHAAPSTYCETPTVTASPSPSGRLTVTAAFCSGPTILSDAVARTNAIASAHDAEFGQLMGDLLSALLPRNNPLTSPTMGGSGR